MLEKTILNSGLTILSEYRPELPSFALSFTLRSGSRVESAVDNGIHHLIEHMLFKGSGKYNLKTIAQISDRLGGALNAFTGKEITQFYIRAMDEKFPEAFDLLSDLILHATFPVEEFKREVGVILQEIRESRDNPDDHAFETFFLQVFPDHSLGFPIAGQEQHVASLNRDGVYRFYRETYRPDRLLLTSAGNINHHDLVKKAEYLFGGFASGPPCGFDFKPPVQSFKTVVKRNTSLQQVYVIIGFEGIPKASPLRFEMMLLNEILGMGMSSRLFQRIREEQGLAYTVHSFADGFSDCGLHLVYAVIEPDNIHPYLDAVRREILAIKKEGISEEELARAKDHLKSSVILGLESNVAKMMFHVNQELYHGREIKLGEILDTINRCRREDIRELLKSSLNPGKAAVLFYGDVPDTGLDGYQFG